MQAQTTDSRKNIGSPFAAAMVWCIRAYQKTAPYRPAVCRFTPTCSEYAVQAIIAHGVWRGLWFGVCRIGRCHPFCPGGHDPVPEAVSVPTDASANRAEQKVLF
ncbi:MAG: membrane protein insertion efficiency factor YidD [Armatimonadetes bacterium]|nr:membrane protein insertion efficiency factor YidD [Armatimonadota bacterium]